MQIERHKDEQTDRETDRRQTEDRQTDRQTDRETDMTKLIFSFRCVANAPKTEFNIFSALKNF